jgi:hypothetical protein
VRLKGYLKKNLRQKEKEMKYKFKSKYYKDMIIASYFTENKEKETCTLEELFDWIDKAKGE